MSQALLPQLRRLDRYTSRAVLLLGAVIGFSSFAFYYSRGLSVAHYDAKAHLVVARRIIDSPTPGYVQMGSHWLPLTHLLYLPFVAFESQYRSGFLPSLLSVLAFALSGWLVFRISYYMTGSNTAGIFAGAVLLGNANLRYLQSCPLTEPLYIAFLLLVLDGLLRWRDGKGGDLPWLPAVWSALSCLCRYEGWYVLGGILVLFAWDFLAGVLSAKRALRAALMFLFAFALPAAAHFGYLYARVQDSFLLRVVQGNPAPYETYRRPFLSLAYHLGELAQIAALVPLVAGLAGIIFCLTQRDLFRRRLPLFLLWLPSLINISALYWGMIYRVRYSVILLPAIAIFASFPATSEKVSRRALLATSFLVMLLPWMSWAFPHEWRYHLLYQGPGMMILPAASVVLCLVAFASGRHGWPLLLLCVLGMQVPALMGERTPILDETLEHSYLEPERQRILEHLSTQYDGSRILIDSMKLAPLIYDSGLPLRDFVCSEGDKTIWDRAARMPEREVGWLCALKGDEIWERLRVDPHWADRYALVSHTDNFVLYHLRTRDH